MEGFSTTSKDGFCQYLAKRRREGDVGFDAPTSDILKEYVVLTKGIVTSSTESAGSEAANKENETRADDVPGQPASPMSKLDAFKATLKEQVEQREPARRRENLENAMKTNEKRRKKEDKRTRVDIPLPQFPQKTVVGDPIPSLRRTELAQALKERMSEKKVFAGSSDNVDLNEVRSALAAPRMSWDWQPDKIDNAKKRSAGSSTLDIEIPDDRGSSRSLAQAELRRAVYARGALGIGTVKEKTA